MSNETDDEKEPTPDPDIPDDLTTTRDAAGYMCDSTEGEMRAPVGKKSSVLKRKRKKSTSKKRKKSSVRQTKQRKTKMKK
jgi:hypothetical protein